MNKPTKHIFVCTSSRMTGVAKGFCHTKGAIEIIQRFTEDKIYLNHIYQPH